ncbi:MAG: DNA-formamidopyrimidine glycosylase [Candidatus Harrisonbacteria bacterium]|nr:DNA-formamidopyrimidine glycosylase [Candidatus Harrisonbacteria bacterium]
MPELPEVQTVVNDLNKKILGKVIVDVWTDSPKLIRDYKSPAQRFSDEHIAKANNNFARFKRDIKGLKVLKAERKGKNVLIHLSGNNILLIHQKMTGHLLFGRWQIVENRARALEPEAVVNDPYNGFIHLILFFKDGSQLALSDMRKFAKAILASRKDMDTIADIAGLGPDALDPKLSREVFSQRIKNSGPTIKQALLKPELIAGIGNIYADEILYTARIHPRQAPKKLRKEELSALYAAMRSVLKKALSLRGTSTSDFRDTAGKKGGYTDQRLVYGREGENCQRCLTSIKRIKVGGRSAHFCPKCQKAKRLYEKHKKTRN